MNKVKSYIKKPVIIQAIKYRGIRKEIDSFCPDTLWLVENGNELLFIKTLEGNHKASIGDYIIKGVKEEFYPCKPDIFELTYEEVNEHE